MIYNRIKVNLVKLEICRKMVIGVIDEKVSKSKISWIVFNKIFFRF